jgi:mono/diheme cytochrome c family protein
VSNPDNSNQTANNIDYRETMDITHVHAAIQREHKEPFTESVPIPLWLMALFGVTLFWSGAYLGMFSGGFSGNVYNERAGLPSPGSGTAGGPEAAGGGAETPVAQGKKIFAGNCAVCHQPTGTGIPGQYPPLAKSEYVNGTPKRLAMILLKGLQGPLKVEGVTFPGATPMPAWEKTLNDKKIAAVLTYIRQEWGNTGGEVTPEQIATARKEFKDRTDSWTQADLLAVPADAILEGAAAPAAVPAAKK